jgi:4-hydroxy-3-methylbut-2-enyl diphosphate reductase
LGTAAEGKGNVCMIETEEEAKEIKFDDGKKLAYLTQTTLSVEETKNIIAILKKRFPEITEPPSSDICFSTTNRQIAVKEIAEKSQVVLVVGSKNSSNSNRLREVAESVGARAYLIDGADEIEESWFSGVKTVGVTAGASAPDVSIRGVVDFLKDIGASEFEEVVSVEEKIRFPLPKIG